MTDRGAGSSPLRSVPPESAMGTCATFECGRPAARHHRWRKYVRVERIGPRGGRRMVWATEGDEVEAHYCDDCSQRLARFGGHDEITPPWPLADVIPLRRNA